MKEGVLETFLEKLKAYAYNISREKIPIPGDFL